jgi:hypothetical protein
MSGKKQAKTTPHVDHARAVLNQATRSDADKVTATRSTTASMQASPSWAAASDVQTAVTKWNHDADAIEAKAQAAGKLRVQLAQMLSDLRVARRSWQVSTDHVLSTVNVFSQGSVDAVKSLSLEVRTRVAPGAPIAPDHLTVVHGTHPGEILAKWKRGSKARHGFVVQHATDTANPATYSAIEPTTRASYTFGGLPSGTVYVRVAAIDPNEGRGPWSQWVMGTVA